MKTLTHGFALILSSLVVAITCASAQQPQVNERLPTSCPILTTMLNAEIDRMKSLQERAKQEEKAPPSDLLSAWQRTFGKKGEGVNALKDLKKVRRRADTLNGALRIQGCAAIDIDLELQVRAQSRPSR